MRPHAKRPCEKRKHQGETEDREYHKEVQESATEMVWPRKEARPRLRMKKTLEMVPPGRRKRGRPKQRWMDGVNRDMRAIGTTQYEVHDITGWRRIVSAAATPQPSGSGWKKKSEYMFNACEYKPDNHHQTLLLCHPAYRTNCMP